MFGTTVYGYLHQLRMDTAKSLLLYQRNSIADIARQLGYKHTSHFRTVFKRHFGVSPGKKRKL